MRSWSCVLLALVVGGCQCGPSANLGSNGGGSTSGAGGGAGATGGGSGTGGAGGAGGSGGPTVTGLVFDPTEATVVLDGTATPKAVPFQLRETWSNGTSTPIDATQVFFDRPDLGSAATGGPVVVTVMTQNAGDATLTAVEGSLHASAKLHVKQEIQDDAVGVPIGAAPALRQPNLPADTALTTLLYPYDATVFPLGLISPLIMWTAPHANDVYRLVAERVGYRYDSVFPGAALGQVRIPQDRWDALTTSSTPADPLKVTLYRYDAASSTAFTSATESWTITDKSLRGAIYYWTTSGSGHMARIRPGVGAMPETIAGGQCMGCHAVSADGTRLVASVEAAASSDEPGQTTRGWVSYDLPGGTELKRTALFGGNLAINPDGKYVVYGTAPLRMADAVTGARVLDSGIETLPLDPGMVTYAHPVFSPDGRHFAAIQSSAAWYEWGASRLMVTSFDEPSQTFGATPTLLATSSQFTAPRQSIAYPSFSPDSMWLAFHVGDHASGCATTCDPVEADVASLYLQPVAGGAPLPLTKLNDSSLNAADHGISFEPTFNPVESGGYFWVVFTSTRNWGNQLTGTPQNGKKRLWVAAIDKTSGAPDPSHPGFFLEGQEDTMNMRGFWTLAACTASGPGSSCSAGFECCSGFCASGKCIDPGPVACKQQLEGCGSTGDCCNPGVFICKDGTCQAAIQ